LLFTDKSLFYLQHTLLARHFYSTTLRSIPQQMPATDVMILKNNFAKKIGEKIADSVSKQS
jgi:hypothetical protein